MESITNKQAHFDYEVLDHFDAGMVLFGHEVKSVKNGQMNLKGSFVTVKHTPTLELYLTNAHISLYKKAGSLPDYSPTRPRRLLLKKHEISGLVGKLEQKGLTLVPLKVYTKRNLIKLEFGLCRGKKQFEKKESIKKKDVERDIRSAMKVDRY